jgi:hypothetical protein
MKKFIAFFVVAILFAVSAQAQYPLGVTQNGTSWQWDGSAEGEFTAEILCVPTFDIGVNGGSDLGNFFLGGDYPLSGFSMQASLTGPATAEVTYTITPTVNGVPGNVMSFLGNEALVLSGWSETGIPAHDGNGNPITDVTLDGTWTEQDGREQFMDCEDPVTATFCSFNDSYCWILHRSRILDSKLSS